MTRFVALSLVIAGPLLAGDIVIPHRQSKPPNRPYSPQEAIARMTVPDGFVVELVAAEPDIANPVAMTFDDRGRIWITESFEYPRSSAGKGRDRIKILEDTTGDGRADKVTVFADDLNIPTGIAIGYGGVWVMNAPDLLFMKERDGREVGREVVLTGFGRTDTHELPNSLTWGPDGFLYGLNGVFNHCRIESGGKEFEFNCALYRINPRTRAFDVFCEGTSNPWGLVWNPEGSALVSTCHWANDHVFHFVETGYYQRQAGPYPPFTWILGSVSDHGHQMTAYCGFAYFDSDSYPSQYRDRLFTGNIHGGCINVDRLVRDGSSYIAKAEPDFLTAHDAWFMPVAQKIGPDGCLYVLDWYDRYHCSQDARRDPEGVDRGNGRLYRIRYRNTPRAPHFDLASETDERLVERLTSPNLFFRESAQRLLTERNTPHVRALLRRRIFDRGAIRKTRLHALWALVGTGSLEPDLHRELLTHADATFRAWAVRAAGNAGTVEPDIRDKVVALARDPAPEVQLQVAIAAGKIDGLDPLAVLVDVLTRCGQDKLIPAIVWQNLHALLEPESARFVRLIRETDPKRGPALAKVLPRAIDRLLSGPAPDFESARGLLECAIRRNVDVTEQCLTAISTRLRELTESSAARLGEALRPVLAELIRTERNAPLSLSAQLLAARLRTEPIDADVVRDRFVSASESAAIRLQALDALIVLRDRKLLEAVERVLASGATPFVAQVFAALGHVDDPKLADVILARYPSLDHELQPLAIDLLMQRERWARRLLKAVRANKIPATVLHANHLRKILESNDREAIWAVEAAFGRIRSERDPQRERVVAEMTEVLRHTTGDALAGEVVFRNLCGQCHVIHGQGTEVGPDLTGNGRASFEQLVSNVFDPSLVIGAGYEVTTVVTEDGRNLTGILTENNDQRVVLKLQGGQTETIARNNIDYTRLSRLSMMPEGIENTLTRQQIADLFAFLALDKHPRDPDARPIAGAPPHIGNPDAQ